MANLVQAEKKIALLHRYPADRIKETNAAFPYLAEKGIDVLTFKKFNRTGKWAKFFKSLAWIFYAPMLVIGKKYDVIYCDDSYPFYPALVKLVSPKSRVVIRLGDLHLMYYYNGFLYELLHFFEEIGWTCADQIIVISEAMKKRLKIEGYSSEVVLDPIDPDDFKKPVRYSDIEIQSSKIVMFHGLVTKNKNLDLIVEAAKKLPSIRFWIVGDGPDLKRLKKISPQNVHFEGWCPFKEIPALIDRCDVGLALRGNAPGNEFVVTSPFLQYGIMGKPCLVTRRAVFGDYKWQFSNVGEMVSKIKTLLSKPEEGEKLRKYVLANHNAKKIADEIWQILA